MQIKLLVVDDDELVLRTRWRSFLTRDLISEVYLAHSGKEAIELVEQHRPEMVLMDLAMPEMTGLEAIRRILELQPDTRCLAVSGYTDEPTVRQALQAGACGYLGKDDTVPEVERAIMTVLAGRRYFSSQIKASIAESYSGSVAPRPRQRPGGLTSREHDVLQLIAEGLNTPKIAAKLGLGERSVESIRDHLHSKLGVTGPALLTRWAIENGVTLCKRLAVRSLEVWQSTHEDISELTAQGEAADNP